jgi:hypothetical protein
VVQEFLLAPVRVLDLKVLKGLVAGGKGGLAAGRLWDFEDFLQVDGLEVLANAGEHAQTSGGTVEAAAARFADQGFGDLLVDRSNRRTQLLAGGNAAIAGAFDRVYEGFGLVAAQGIGWL